MKKIAIINGPNLNLLGLRNPSLYGHETLTDINNELISFGKEKNIKIECFQSNYEGGIVEYIHQCLIFDYDYIIINPAAYTHTSIAILDALEAVRIPFIEVHLTDVDNRESFRKESFIRDLAEDVFKGEGIQSYKNAIMFFYSQKKRELD